MEDAHTLVCGYIVHGILTPRIKRIAIFTYDIASGRDIKFQLMKMKNNKLMQMYNFNTLNFFYTKDKVNKEIVDYLNQIGH